MLNIFTDEGLILRKNNNEVVLYWFCKNMGCF